LDAFSVTAAKAKKEGVQELRIVLLGDIFELLKSGQWLESTCRPWDEPSPEHQNLVLAIFQGVLDANRGFFDGLKRLKGSFPFVGYDYIPGNHDRLLGIEMGRLALEKLCSELPVTQDSRGGFPDRLVEEEYGVLARHGHEWDPTNRYSEGGAAIGDAIVIELLVRFPKLIREKVGLSDSHADLQFLDEMDNVRPNKPRFMADWILRGLNRITEGSSQVRGKIDDALSEMAAIFHSVLREVRFSETLAGDIWLESLRELPGGLVRKAGRLRFANLVKSEGEGVRPWTYLDAEADAFPDANGRAYAVSGHTHLPEIEPLHRLWGSPFLYLNTGTWKRVHRVTGRTTGRPGFSSWEEECLVIIRSPIEQRGGSPPFEFHRITCGPLLLIHPSRN